MMNFGIMGRSNTAVQQLTNTTIHEWYRFVLSYPDHLVSDLLTKFEVRPHHTVLDPFVGTGTTLVECKQRGIYSIGLDANPVTAFASQVKTTWNVDLGLFDDRFSQLRSKVQTALQQHNLVYTYQLSFDDLLLPSLAVADKDEFDHSYQSIHQLVPQNWISPRPLQKCLIIKELLDTWPEDSITNLFRLALVKVLVAVSNLGFGPEVYVAKKREDADVYNLFVAQLQRVKQDLRGVRSLAQVGETAVYVGDARKLTTFIKHPIDFVICSPPYPNEKDYTRITRLELILLEFVQNKNDLRMIKENMLRSHTRNIYVSDNDSCYVEDMPEIQQISQEIEAKRRTRGATSGFEKLYHRVVTEYFGGMYRVLEQIQHITQRGAKLAFVLGDQMSYFQVPIRTAYLLSLVACRQLNYKETETLLWRTRKATATKMDVAEHVLILERC